MDYRRRPYDQLRELADAFLIEHHPTGTIPVPIETIVEFELGLEVIPVLGLQEEFETVGFLALGRRAIYVDERVMMQRLGRYRFTLAYEAARYVLQGDICPKSIKTIPDFVKWQADLSESVRNDSKYEAYDFGGLVLVPSLHLLRELNKGRAKVDQAMGRRHWQSESFIWMGIAEEIARAFDVSSQVVQKRLRYDRLLPNGVRL